MIPTMTTSTGPDLCYALAARKKARYLTRLYDTRLAAAGLSVSQFSILTMLEAHQRLKLAELADLLIMERTSLLRALKPLQTAGCVVTERSGTGRTLDVRLSPAGLDKVAEATPLWLKAQADFEDEVGQQHAIRHREEVLAMKLGG